MIGVKSAMVIFRDRQRVGNEMPSWNPFLGGALRKNWDIRPAWNLNNQGLVASLRLKIQLDPLAQFTYAGADYIVSARVIAFWPPKDLDTDSLFGDFVVSLFDRAFADVEQQLLEPGCAFQVGTGGDALKERPVQIGTGHSVGPLSCCGHSHEPQFPNGHRPA